MNFVLGRIKSFKFAFQGILVLFKTQVNAKIHLFTTLLATALGFYFSISTVEWLVLVLAICIVLITEGVNTAIEFLGDAITENDNLWIGKAKDVGAGAVLIASIGAIIVGLIIFLPKFLNASI